MILKLDNLTIRNRGRSIVDNISFNVNRGEILGIAGASGSGKTMTALAILGLLPKNMKVSKQSSILFLDDEIDILKKTQKELCKIRGDKVSMIFQDPAVALNPTMRVGEQILEVYILHKTRDIKKAREKIIDKMNLLNLDGEKIFFKYPHELSGGQRQRIMILIATICEPELIIADEPTTALDKESENKIIDLLKKINADNKSSMIFISHNLGLIKTFCDRVAIMKEGKIVEQAESSKLFCMQNDKYTKELINSLKIPDFKKSVIRTKKKALMVENLSIYYKEGNSKKYVIRDLSFDVRHGEIVGISGINGIGKTSIINAILGFIDTKEGKISVLDKKPQIIFQDHYTSLNPKKTIKFILEEPLKLNFKMSKDDRMQRIKKMLVSVGLDEEYLTRYPHELSGGQRQRISIVVALLTGARFIIADEPISSLDAMIGKQIVELLYRLNKEMGITILIVLHDKILLEKLCHRVIEIKGDKDEEFFN